MLMQKVWRVNCTAVFVKVGVYHGIKSYMRWEQVCRFTMMTIMTAKPPNEAIFHIHYNQFLFVGLVSRSFTLSPHPHEMNVYDAGRIRHFTFQLGHRSSHDNRLSCSAFPKRKLCERKIPMQIYCRVCMCAVCKYIVWRQN